MSYIEYVDNFEEVDLAFSEKLLNCKIDGKEVPVVYYSPDVDLATLEKPSIAIFRNPPFPDYSRWKQDAVIDNHNYDTAGNLISVSSRKPPEPWSIMYTVRTVYEHQLDGVALNRFLFRLFPRGSYITIKNIGYDVRYLNGHLSGSQYKDFGRTEDGKKTLGETYIYRVDILLDLHDRETIGVASGIETRTQQK